MIKRLLSFLVAALLTFCSVTAHAAQYARLTDDCLAKVTRIIDGDSILVETKNSKQLALVRLSGIDARGFEGGVKHLTNTILGNTVFLSFLPDKPRYIDGRWNNMHVTYNMTQVNESLVSLGYAAVLFDEGADVGDALIKTQDAAKAAGFGLWNTESKYLNQYPYSVYGNFYNPTSPYNPDDLAVMGSGLNINTALFGQLSAKMPDVPPSVINDIIVLRARRPFKSIADIKFIPGFTEVLFNKYRSQIVVCTNLLKATDNELITLGSITQAEVAAIIDYRKKYSFKAKSDLLDERLVSSSVYGQISDFIAVSDVFELNATVPKDAAFPINKATKTQLISAGLSDRAAEAVITGRQSHTYKTLGELMYLPGLYLSYREVYALSDNLLLDAAADCVNVNLAPYDSLIEAGFTQSQANALMNYRGRMFCAADLPAGLDIARLDSRITFLTNINRAPRAELLSLGISPEAADKIESYRKTQYFGGAEELGRLLAPLNAGTYNNFDAIKLFITVL